MRELALQEYQTSEAVQLSVAERDHLKRLCSSISITPTAGRDGFFDITPGSEVGTIQVDDLSVLIRPKLDIKRVLFLVAYALDGARFQDLEFEYGKERDLFESIIPGFIAQVRRAFRPGLLQGYRMEESALPTVRGRIRFDDQIRDRFGVMPPVEVRYDEFTDDIELNRLIKAAIGRIGRVVVRSDDSRRALRSFDGIFVRVASIEYGRNAIPDPTFNRLNEHYKAAIRLAQLILRSTSFDVRQGEVSSLAFLIDMNRVFEDFVVFALRDELGLDERQFPQNGRGKRLKLDELGRIPLKPDISWWADRRCLFVGDVKYKRTRNEGVPNADLYQLLAYTTATGLPGGLLVYAAGEDKPVNHTVRHAGKALEIVTLDLAGDPSDVLLQIEDLAAKVRRYRTSALPPAA